MQDFTDPITDASRHREGHSHFLTPYLRRNRFFEAIRNGRHKVFPLLPDETRNFVQLLDAIVDEADEQAIFDLDGSDVEIGFLTGLINNCTVVEVRDAIGQDWMDELGLQPGARIWTPTARYYLFNYIEARVKDLPKCAAPGLRVLNDGDWTPYPGNLMEGHLVHWEHDSWEFGTHPLPDEFWVGVG